MNQANSLFEKHKEVLKQAIEASSTRNYYTPFPESPRAYSETGDAEGKNAFSQKLNNDFKELLQSGESAWLGEEVSPYLMVGLGINYPAFSVDTLIQNAKNSSSNWAKDSAETRAVVLLEPL